MLKKLLNANLVQARLRVSNSFRNPCLSHQVVAQFADSKPPRNPSGQGKDGETPEGTQKKSKGAFASEKKDSGPRIMEPKKKDKPEKSKGLFSRQDRKEIEQRYEREDRDFGGERGDRDEKPFKSRRHEEGGVRSFKKGPFAQVPEGGERTEEGGYEIEKKLRRELGLEDPEMPAPKPQRSEEDFLRAKAGKVMRIFGKKEFTPGMVLGQMGVELKSTEHVVQEMTPQNHDALLNRITSLKRLENTQKKYEGLLECYVLSGNYGEVEKAYDEIQKHGLKKNGAIENYMFEALLKSSYTKAKNFFAYLKENNKLEDVYVANMNRFIELQIANEYFEEVAATLKALKLENFNFGSLDIALFNTFFDFEGITNKSQYKTDFSSRKDFVFIRKAEIFIEYFREILRRKPAQLESFPFLFKFKIFFGVLNDLHYPQLKLDSNGLDVCMSYLEVLAASNLVTPRFVEFEDLARWVALYFDLPDALRRVQDIVKGIPNNEEFFPFLLNEMNNHIANKGEIPFDAASVHDLYASIKEELDKSKRRVNIETVRLILEVAQAHKQHDIIFDVYENYGKLVHSNEHPLFLYVYLTNAFTFLNLSSKNAFQIVGNLMKEYSSQYGKFPANIENIVKVKALIRDGKFEEAHSLFNNEFHANFVPSVQRTILQTMLTMVFLPIEDVEEEEEDDSIRKKKRFLKAETSETINKITQFVNSLSDTDLIEMHSKIESDNFFLHKLAGIRDTDSHIAYWKSVAEDPTELKAKEREMRVRCKEEVQRIISERVAKYIAEKKGQVVHEEIVEPHDEEARNLLIHERTNYDEKDLDLDRLTKDDVMNFFIQTEMRTEIEEMLKLPLKSKSARQGSTLSATQELQSKSALDAVNDLIVWGIYVNEPLAVRLGEEFYSIIGHKMSPYLTGQLQLYYKYQLTSRADQRGTSFKYTQEHTRNVPRNFLDANSPYSVIEDDQILDEIIEGFQEDRKTIPLFERLVRSQSLLKRDLLNNDEACANFKKGGRVNFIN